VSPRPVDATSIKITRAKLNAGIKSNLKRVKFFQGDWMVNQRTVSVNDFITKQEFDAPLSSYGTLVQPTAENIPNSKV
jgi:hypothetical protein